MKTSLPRWLVYLSSCAIVLHVVTTAATAQDYQVTRQDYDYLQHYSVINAFDSALINYVFGEVQVGNQTQRRRILPDTVLKLDSVLYNGNSTGNQTTLAAALRTHPFVIDSLDSLVCFHRELRARMINAESGEYTVLWRFNDRSEFVVQLCRQSDNVVLAILDSVGVDSSSSLTANAAVPYGTHFEQWSRVSVLPPGLASTQVYLRVVPRLLGNGPFGMTAFRVHSRMSRSLLYGQSASNQAGDSIPYHDSVRFHLIVQSFNDEFAEKCYFSERNYLELAGAQGDSLRSAFFVVDSAYYNASGMRRFLPITCNQAKERLRLHQMSTGTTVTNSANGLVVHTNQPTSTIVMTWFDLSGRYVSEQRSVSVTGDGTMVPYPTGLPMQPYLLRWYEDRSGTFGTLLVPTTSGQR